MKWFLAKGLEGLKGCNMIPGLWGEVICIFICRGWGFGVDVRRGKGGNVKYN